MTLDEIKNEYITKIRSDLEQALNFIIPLLRTDRQLFKDFINIDGRHSHINTIFNQGGISSEKRTLELNQIRISLVEFHGKLSSEDLAENTDLSAKDSEKSLVNLYREAKSELEKLKQENVSLKGNTPVQAQKMKIIVKCQPEISDRPNNYECLCIIFDEDSGDEREEKVPLRKEPGGLIVTLQEIKPTDFVQLKIKGENKEWESEYFSASFQSHILQAI